MAKVFISSRKYEISHFKAPRGSGSWIFFIGGDEGTPFSFTGTYAAARKAAVAEAKRVGATTVSVAP